jgi:hypothetical protein
MAVWHLARNRGQAWGCRLSHEEQALRDARAPVGRYGATACFTWQKRALDKRPHQQDERPANHNRTD